MESEEMTEYERKRLENIKRNSQMMASLKIHSHLSDLSSSSKRLREEKSYKQNAEKKSKAETPVVIRRRSLRIQEIPPDSADLPVKSSKSRTMNLSSSPESDPLPLEDLSMEQTYEGEEGSHLALVKKLGRFTVKINSDDDNGHLSLNSPTQCEKVKVEEPTDPCPLKVVSDDVAFEVPQRSTRKTNSDGQDDHPNSRTKSDKVEVEEGSDPCSLKLESDDASCVVRRRSARKTQSDEQDDHSTSKFERVTVEEGIDPRSLKFESDNVPRVVSRRSTRKTKSDEQDDHSKSPTKFERVKGEEGSDPCSLKLESENVSRVAPRRSTRKTKLEVEGVHSKSPTKFERVKVEEGSNPCSSKLKSDDIACVVPRRSTRKTKLDVKDDHSNSPIKFERVEVEEGIDPHSSNVEYNDIACGMPQKSTRKATSDDENGHSNFPVNFERVKLEEPIDPRSLKLEDDNIARVVPGRIFSIQFFPTAEMTMVAVGNKYGHLGFWDVKPQNGEEEDVIHLYKPHSAPISGISVHPFTLSKVYSGCYDGILRMMNVESEKFELLYTSTYGASFLSLAQQPNDANTLYLGEGPGGLIRFDVRMGEVSSNWPLHVGRVNSIDFSPINSNIMATSSTDGFACIWDLRNMKVKVSDKQPERRALYYVKHARAVHSAYFSPSGSCLATTSLDDNIGVLCGANFEDTLMIPHDNWTNRWVSSFRAVWGWDDTHLYIGNMKRRVDVLSVTHKKTVHTLESSNMSAIPCRYDAHPCNVGMMAGATSGGQVYIWTASS